MRHVISCHGCSFVIVSDLAEALGPQEGVVHADHLRALLVHLMDCCMSMSSEGGVSWFRSDGGWRRQHVPSPISIYYITFIHTHTYICITNHRTHRGGVEVVHLHVRLGADAMRAGAAVLRELPRAEHAVFIFWVWYVRWCVCACEQEGRAWSGGGGPPPQMC